MEATLRTIAVLLIIRLAQAKLPTQEERDAILDFHNQVRMDVQPTAKNMKKMVIVAKP